LIFLSGDGMTSVMSDSANSILSHSTQA
jgi:hypothetical protein